MTQSSVRLTQRLWLYQLVVVFLATGVTLLVASLPALSFGYRNADLHVALETAACLIAALAAFLLHGRWRRTGTIGDLALFAALVVLTLHNLIVIASPAAGALDRQAVWVPLFCALVATGALTAASFAPSRPIRRPWPGLVLAIALAALAGALLLGLRLGPQLATGIDPTLSPASSNHPRVLGTAGLLACQLISALLLALASLGFTLRARREDDELLAWLAIAATVGAFGRLNYFLFPSGFSEWVFTGDFFRLLFYVLILVGATRQIVAYQRSAEAVAVLEERRRIARDLHDGLAQELAFISTQASELARQKDAWTPIAIAADRALADSRGAIAALASTPEEALDVSVARLATALTQRSGVALKLELADGVEADDDRREALLRVLSESISNAIRHGSPSTLWVALSSRPARWRTGLRLIVIDDGAGFNPTLAGNSGGLGIEGMTERIERLGGSLTVNGHLGMGTEVEVLLP